MFKTTNALAAVPTWANVSPPVDLPHNAIVVDGRDTRIVYVGTDIGVWRSNDAGGTWTHMGPETGMPNVAVFDLKINTATNRLVAFTHGRGAFALSPRVPALTAAVLPSSRSVLVGAPATAFATVINAGALVASGVRISRSSPIPADFSFQTTDPATNQVIGTPNAPVDIPPGQNRTFVMSLTPHGRVDPVEVVLVFGGTDGDPAPTLPGVDTLLLSANPPVPTSWRSRRRPRTTASSSPRRRPAQRLRRGDGERGRWGSDHGVRRYRGIQSFP